MERSLKTFNELWTEIDGAVALGDDWRQTLRADSLRGTVPPLPPMTIEQGVDTDADLVVSRVLGEGGMGTVFLANQRSLEREVAIKQLKPEATESHRAGLLREGRFMGTLEHPNIVPVHAMGLDQEGLPTLVMKRIEGTSWDELLRGDADWEDHGSWPDDPLVRSVQVLIEVCKAMQFAHSRGVLHRDLKPANVMVGRFGEVYVVDWGVACRWEDRPPSGRLVGTPAYMAPEMVDPTAPVDPRTDVYLLGACLYEVLTGHPPHDGPDLRSVLASAHRSEPAAPSEAPEELAELCRTTMEADPADRPQDVAAFRASLTAYLQHRGANRLAAEADDRLARVDALLAETPDDPAAQAPFREAEFAFRQARVEWPESAHAVRGLGRLLSTRARWSLARNDPEAAVADLALADELAVAVEDALRHEVQNAKEQWDELRFRAQQEDLRPRYRDRKRAIAAMLAALSLLGLLQSERLMSPWVPYGSGWLFGLIAAFAPVNALVLWSRRKRLLADRASQRIVALMTANGAAVLMHRLWGWWFHLEPWQVLGGDMWIVSAMSFAMAITVRKGLWTWGVICAVCAMLTGAWPGWAGEIYLLGAVLILAQLVAFDYAEEVH